MTTFFHAVDSSGAVTATIGQLDGSNNLVLPPRLMGGTTAGGATQAASIDAGTGGVITADANGAAFQGVVLITPGTATAAKRSLGYICTSPGNVTLTLADGSTITLPVQAGGFQTLPFAVTNLTLGAGAFGTFWNLV